MGIMAGRRKRKRDSIGTWSTRNSPWLFCSQEFHVSK
jgi:hypothetical protein